jgi:hypothetical protein
VDGVIFVGRGLGVYDSRNGSLNLVFLTKRFGRSVWYVNDLKKWINKIQCFTSPYFRIFKNLAGQLATVTECERYAPIARVGASLSRRGANVNAITSDYLRWRCQNLSRQKLRLNLLTVVTTAFI